MSGRASDSGPQPPDSGNFGLASAQTLLAFSRPSYAPPRNTPGVPSDAELEASGAVIGKIVFDNQNIFDLSNPQDDTWLFRLADRLHERTKVRTIRDQLLFRPGQRYSRRLLDESERILRANGYFYDAWIRTTGYRDGKVDLRVTTKDVWTLNPGLNFGRSGGTNHTGVQLEDLNFLGSGIDLKLAHSSSVDRTSNELQVTAAHALGSFISVIGTYANQSDGYLRELSVQQPFYALDTRWAAGVYSIDDLQTDSLWDHGQIIDQFKDLHKGAQIYGALSAGLVNGWVRRWSVGLTYDEHTFYRASSWAGITEIPQDRRFVYPWLQFDLVEDDYERVYNHDQIARTEDFYLGTAMSARVGWAAAGSGSSQTTVLYRTNASTGFRSASNKQTLLLFWDFNGRMSDRRVQNGVMDTAIRYYVEQSKNWLFFTTLYATKGWRLDLDDQILLGGDSGLRGYPLRYQDGTGRALWTLEQRYFTDWYPFRLFRVGGAIFFDVGRTWGRAPLASPNYGALKDVGFGGRFGNSRSGLGNVVHVDVAFPMGAPIGISKVQFLVKTEAGF
ncbi:MAG: hypothetical protein JOZ89_01320 [Gammaproteobacteria bacterium]|nr:hypothetical protein [Gammaproteobacteria bacterium]